ncbi:MAG: hypothetical protein ABEJ99_01715 [Candidatus Nanohaloarchaea archaeon]
MEIESKGFYFSLDALLALMILSAALGLVFETYSVEEMTVSSWPDETAINGLKQPIDDLNSTYNYTEQISVFQAVRSSYIQGKKDKARNIAEQYLEEVSVDKASIYLLNRSESALVYNTTDRPTSAEVRAKIVYLPYRDAFKTYYNAIKVVNWN